MPCIHPRIEKAHSQINPSLSSLLRFVCIKFDFVDQHTSSSAFPDLCITHIMFSLRILDLTADFRHCKYFEITGVKLNRLPVTYTFYNIRYTIYSITFI